MQNVVDYIQKNVLRDRSKILTPILTNLFNEIIKEVYDFHDWRFLQESTTQVLSSTVTQYNLSGANQDLGKIIDVLYGDDMVPLDEFTEKEFYRTTFGQRTETSPICFVPLKRPNPFSWTVIIYPCSVASPETLTYYYKRIVKPSDFNLFSNPLVFVHGILGNYFTHEKKDSQKADRRFVLYDRALESMKKHDTPTVHRRSKIVISDERRRLLASAEYLRNLRVR